MIERLRELLDKVPPGPWVSAEKFRVESDGTQWIDHSDEWSKDIHSLAVEAVNALPDLIEAARALEKMTDWAACDYAGISGRNYSIKDLKHAKAIVEKLKW